MKMVSSHRGGPFLLWTLVVQLLLCGSGVFSTDSTTNCKLLRDSDSERKVLKRLEPLAHKNFTATTTGETESYTFVFTLCGDAGGVPGAGVIQYDSKKTEPEKNLKVIGRYNATQAFGGSDWVMLIYTNGDRYAEHCSKEMRKAMIMISCDKTVAEDQMKVVLEDRERTQDCFYMFELDSRAMCEVVQSHISTGSIILIIGFCLLAVYLIGGFLYQRLIVGAKGMEQFPNYAFWVEVGNMTADGCDFVCRSRNREGAPAYRGQAIEPLEEEPEERDDHLLPM